jgi:hypothetical protein
MKFSIPEIPEEDTKNPTVNMLVEMLWNCFRIIQEQNEQIAQLKDEIAKLKGQKPRPKFPPSKTADDAKNKSNSNNSANRTINHEKLLLEYKKDPKISNQEVLSKRFDNIFGKKYKSSAINEFLAHTRSRKEGLLLVLKYPFIPLHNNDSERDIREYVKKRKISGSTRSKEGRQARDTFTMFKKNLY